ncbi:MAG: sulfatase activating formylglycine-generating enzyme [Planctomycetota bacterium]|jgi:formylglycine-generating enzyme required for sulfatase activity
MNADQWKRLKALRERALELKGAQREAFLKEECRDDPELLAELKRLLGDTDIPDEFLTPLDLEKVVNPDWHYPKTLGDFELISEIGRGGVGVVFLAKQAGLERKVAVKALPPYVTRSQRDVDRFQREGHAVSLLNHPGIVSIYAVGQDADTPYFAMEYVEGRTLFDELKILRGEGEPGEEPLLPAFESKTYLAEAVALCVKICEALQYAHDQGVVHRDVKPQNLLLDRDGNPILADFGLARVEEYGTISRSGDVLGTVHYMSPEQARMVKETVDHRTDVYSMGVVLYEMLTMVRPFEGTTSAEVLHRIAWEDPKPVRERNSAVARDLETICDGAITKDPNRRYSSAGELAADLTRFLEHRAIERIPPTSFERARDWMLSHRKYIVAAVLILVATIAGARGQQMWARKELAQQTREAVIAALDGFDTMQAQEVKAVLELAREQEKDGALSEGEIELIRQLEERCFDRVSQLRRKGQAALVDLLSAKNRTNLDIADFGREPQLVEGIEALTSAAVLSGSIEELADDLVRLSTISLTVRVRPEEFSTNARVYIRRLDPYTDTLGELIEIGATPLAAIQLASGHYKIIVDQPGIGFAELKRWFPHRGQAYEVEAWIRPEANELNLLQNGMTRVEASSFEQRYTADSYFEVQVGSFLIDESLVTNAEYEEFMQAQGLSSLDNWGPLEEQTEDWLERPATQVSISDARRYAEWRGKRLVTYAEWQIAARGSKQDKYPWGNEFDQTRFDLFNVGKPDPFDTPRSETGQKSQYRFWYDKYVRPVVDVPTDCRGPHNMRGLLGNVWEWADTSTFRVIPDGLIAQPRSYMRVGGSCVTHLDYLQREGLAVHIWGNDYALMDTGFRCAKSVNY